MHGRAGDFADDDGERSGVVEKLARLGYEIVAGGSDEADATEGIGKGGVLFARAEGETADEGVTAVGTAGEKQSGAGTVPSDDSDLESQDEASRTGVEADADNDAVCG